MKLDDLTPHTWAEITSIEAPDEAMERLMSMGVCPGRTVELVMRGDPLILRVFGTRIGLSSRLASRVTVEPCHQHCDEEEPGPATAHP